MRKYAVAAATESYKICVRVEIWLYDYIASFELGCKILTFTDFKQILSEVSYRFKTTIVECVYISWTSEPSLYVEHFKSVKELLLSFSLGSNFPMGGYNLLNIF